MKKKLLPIIIIAIIALIAATVLVVLLAKNKNYGEHEIVEKDNKNSEIIEISYSYGGGFGTMVDTADKTITFTPDGKVKLSNSYNSYTETLNINHDQYYELKNLISNHLSLFDEKPEEATDVLDGGHSSIKIKLENGKSKEIGGYMIKNKNYDKIEDKVFEIVDNETLIQYKNNISVDE